LLLSQFSFFGLDPLRHVLLEVLFSRLRHIVPYSDKALRLDPGEGTDRAQLNTFGHQNHPKPAVIFYVVLPSLNVWTENELFIAVWRSPTSLPRAASASSCARLYA